MHCSSVHKLRKNKSSHMEVHYIFRAIFFSVVSIFIYFMFNFVVVVIVVFCVLHMLAYTSFPSCSHFFVFSLYISYTSKTDSHSVLVMFVCLAGCCWCCRCLLHERDICWDYAGNHKSVHTLNSTLCWFREMCLCTTQCVMFVQPTLIDDNARCLAAGFAWCLSPP